jgi:phosphonate transport system permease protein
MSHAHAIAGSSNSRIADFEHRFQTDRRTRLLWTLLYLVLFAGALLGSMQVSDFNPGKLMNGLPKAWNYIYGTFPTLRWETLGADIAEWYWGIRYWLRLLLETVLMGFIGTALGGVMALVLCFFASRNLAPNNVVYFASQRVLEFLRTVPELVFALIFVYAFGLGPFAGVLAIAIHTAGSLGKLFAEVNENVDERPACAPPVAPGLSSCGWPWCRRRCPIMPATCCCASRSMCAAPRCLASSAPGALARISMSPSASSNTPISAP